MGNLRSLVGQRFERWTVLSRVERTKNRATRYLCRCDCGTERLVFASNLQRGLTKSCGCLNLEVLSVRSTTHGQSRTGKRTKAYSTWTSMKTRCSNPNNRDYPNYGGRGIRVCPQWESSFEAFLSDIGEPPGPEYSLDRIDPEGNYEPGNVRWANSKEQRYNQRVPVKTITFEGMTKTVGEWAEYLGIKRVTLAYRLRNGWSIPDALTAPLDKKRARHG